MPRKPRAKITMPRIQRAKAMRERGMSYRAISTAMEVYEGGAPSERTIRDYLLAAGCPKNPRNATHTTNFKRAS